MTVTVSVRPTVYDMRERVTDFSAAASTWYAVWLAALNAASTANLPIVVSGTSPFRMDLDGAVANNRIAVPSGSRMIGSGKQVIRCYNDDSASEDGSGFYVDTSSEDLWDIFFEYMMFEGKNGSSWGNAFSFVSNLDTMPIRFFSNDADNELRNFGVRFNTFKHLNAFPAQAICTMDHGFGGWFDNNFMFQCNRALNLSSPYSSINFNRFEQSQVAEFAAAMMTVIGNIAKDHYGNLSIGATGLTTGSRYGNIIALNAFDEQIQSAASAQVATTDGAESTLIALNQMRRANARVVLLGSTVTHYGAPRSRVLGNMMLSPGNIANGGSRIAIDVDQDYADIDLNTIYNETPDIATWATQTGIRVQGDDGGYDRNRLDGVSNHVQFNGGKRNYWGAGNIYDVTKVTFANVPTDASQFLNGSFLRGNNVSPGTSNRPTAAIGYRGLTWSYESDSTSYGDATFKCVRLPSGNYGWVHIGEERGVARSASFTATAMDGGAVILMTSGASDRTVTLPAVASNEGMVISMVKVDSGAGKAIFDGNSSENINGATTLELVSQWDRAKLYCDGTQWVRVA